MRISTVCGILLFFILLLWPAGLPAQSDRLPLDMAKLKAALSFARDENIADEPWPRAITYEREIYEFKSDRFQHEPTTVHIQRKPQRIIPHGVGVSEILWAICPPERLIAFNELCANSRYSFIADQVKQAANLFNSKQTERIIGYRPDLVFTVFFSGSDFKEKLIQAHIPFVDLGYFGTLESITKQIVLIGRIIGEEGNAAQLIRVIDESIQRLKARVSRAESPKRLLFYDEGGYVPGKFSNFNSICRMIGAENLGASEGIFSWSQIDYETLLKWDPDIIIVPEGSRLKAQLTANAVLAYARAIKTDKVFEMPYLYLNAGSQFMVLSANLLAGFVYEQAF